MEPGAEAPARAPAPAAVSDAPVKAPPKVAAAAKAAAPVKGAVRRKTAIIDTRSEDYYQIKSTIFSALIDTIDLAQLAQLDPDSAREEIRDIVNEIISIKAVVMSIAEQEALLQDICNDVLGYGPAGAAAGARDDISDIMVNGANRVFIEVAGARSSSPTSGSATTSQLMNICQRIVSQGRPPCRRKLADLRRAPARRLSCERDRPAAGAGWSDAHHS